MAEAKASKKAAPARKVARKKVAAKKAPAKKAAAKKAPGRKTPAKKVAAKRKPAPRAKADLKANAIESGRKALQAGLGVYGMAYDQILENLETVQSQVDEAQAKLNERRKQAEKLYEALVKRGKAVEKDALKAFEDLELDALTDRAAFDEQMAKAKSKFDALRTKVSKLI